MFLHDSRIRRKSKRKKKRQDIHTREVCQIQVNIAFYYPSWQYFKRFPSVKIYNYIFFSMSSKDKRLRYCGK